LLGGAAERDFIRDALEDEARLVAGFAFEGEGGLKVEDERAVESGEGRRGEEIFVLPEGCADHERRGVFQKNAGEIAFCYEDENVTNGNGYCSLRRAQADVVFG
jgi:hypothetical protein